MDSDIQFGEVAEESPRQALRPDKNRHFAVAEYGTPAAGELPIFVDLDVARDMEAHAQSDTSVELGGVLLGGHFEDDDGQPFVLVTDSLRAEHYESTKGSFKFTHDTWSAITREREQFPADLQMAGWYHTHPDWGVFLSGMDMFICDNFFNKRLDVAYVIDPCRGDRGMFQWTGDPRHRVRRTGGFYIVASRFRQAELEHYVAQLEGKISPMGSTTSPSGYGSPVIHVATPHPPPPPPPWQGIAIIGALVLQACLLGLIAWKLIGPSAPAAGESTTSLAAQLDQMIRNERLKERMETQNQVLDKILVNLKDTEPGFAKKLEEQLDKSQDLALDVETYRAQLAAQQQTEELTRARLEGIEKDLVSTKEYLQSRIEKLQAERDLMVSQRAEARAEVAALKEQLNPKPDGDKQNAEVTLWGVGYVWWIVGGSLGALVLVAAVAIALRKPESESKPEDASEPESESEPRAEESPKAPESQEAAKSLETSKEQPSAANKL
jgi:proteasome lid subunit RPN8/RPN11